MVPTSKDLKEERKRLVSYAAQIPKQHTPGRKRTPIPLLLLQTPTVKGANKDSYASNTAQDPRPPPTLHWLKTGRIDFTNANLSPLCNLPKERQKFDANMYIVYLPFIGLFQGSTLRTGLLHLGSIVNLSSVFKISAYKKHLRYIILHIYAASGIASLY